MPDFAFSAGVKPGGLTSSTEIRILLCYLLATVGEPLTREEIEAALIGQQLVNYFEYATALGTLAENELLSCDEEGRYTVTEKGARIAGDLSTTLPRSVRESAVRAAISALRFSQKKRQHHARYTRLADGSYSVHCEIADSQGAVFSLDMAMPDDLTAQAVCTRFVEQGAEIYQVMLAAVTGSKALLGDAMERLTAPPQEEPEKRGD